MGTVLLFTNIYTIYKCIYTYKIIALHKKYLYTYYATQNFTFYITVCRQIQYTQYPVLVQHYMCTRTCAQPTTTKAYSMYTVLEEKTEVDNLQGMSF
jgi:hypothetical protein